MSGKIYKVVGPDGSITFTDQPNGTPGRTVTLQKPPTPAKGTQAQRARASGLDEIAALRQSWDAPNQAAVIAAEKAAAEATLAQKNAYARVDRAAAQLNAARGELSSAIARANEILELKDAHHDQVGIALGVAGLLVAGILGGVPALVVGGALWYANKRNSDGRQKTKGDAPASATDIAGNVNDGVGFTDDALDIADKYRKSQALANGLTEPARLAARTPFGVLNAAGGLALATNEAIQTTSMPLRARINTAEELRAFPATVDKFEAAYDNIEAFDGDSLKFRAEQALEAQIEFDEALKAAIASDFAVRRADMSWSQAKAAVPANREMAGRARDAAAAIAAGESP